MMRTIAIAGPMLLALVGCTSSADLSQMQSNEGALREMVANNRQQIEQLQEKIRQQNDRIAELEHSDANQDNDTAPDRRGPPAASPAAPAEAATPAEAQAPPGAPPDATGAPPAAGAAAGAEEAALTPPAAAAPPAAPPATVVSAAPTWQAAVNRELAARQNDVAAKLYRAGLVDLKAGKFQPALAKFQDLQRRYPKSSLSEPAEYFSGNALFELGQPEKSILQFNDLTMRYPEGRFASAALLREAQAFVKINDQIDARLTLHKLLNDHPDAPEAPMAKSMMDSLSS